MMNDWKSDAGAQQIRNGRGARVALCAHPTRIKKKHMKEETSGTIVISQSVNEAACDVKWN
jgi:hypothetical protein